MLYVVLADGQVEEIPNAVTGIANDGTFSCRDARGAEVSRYERGQVLVFSRDESVKQTASAFRSESGTQRY